VAKRPRHDDDDDDNMDDNVDGNTDSNRADMSLSWPHCFTTDRLADSAAVMPFER